MSERKAIYETAADNSAKVMEIVQYEFYPVSRKPLIANAMLLIYAEDGTWIGTYDGDCFFEEQWGEEIQGVIAWAILKNPTMKKAEA